MVALSSVALITTKCFLRSATYAAGQIKALNNKLTAETDPKQRAALIDE